MNWLKKCWCRTFQFVFKMAMPFLPYREPQLLKDSAEVAKVIKEKNLKKTLIVTDQNLIKFGLTTKIEQELKQNNIDFAVFDQVFANPTISQVENGQNFYKENNCDNIVAIGGGSVMDCAKLIGARVSNPNKNIVGMKGLMKINKKLPLLIAVPTTAGTGSETTVAAVITDDSTHHKFAINDFKLIPQYALLDANLTIGLGKFTTATTGMDALTHAVEAYIGRSTTKKTRQASLEAIELIFQNLEKTYNDGTNIEARKNMLKASYLAGVAFTRSYVGYVHAVAHSLGGKYNVPHGYANAIILPIVLKQYGTKIHKKLEKIAKYVGIAGQKDIARVAAQKFISWIEELNQKFEIPEHISELRERDIPELAKTASKEANPLYPVPVLFDKTELENIYQRLLRV